MIRRSLALAAAGAVLAAAGTACTPSSSDSSTSEASSAGSLTVAAASSLTDVFEVIGADFTKSTGIDVAFSFAASSAIAEQIRGGAPLDAFASAGTSSMEPLATEGLVTDVTAFATNTLMIATPPGNPGGIASLADLPGATVLVCQEQVPCGVATAKLFELNGLDIAPVSFEPDVVSVLGKIEADEADAGIVYVTDVLAGGAKVEGIEIPAADNVTTTYQGAVVRDAAQAEAAALFVAYLTAPQAQAAFAAAGFAPAP
jgi:molybdate transport system substrate-binding protein